LVTLIRTSYADSGRIVLTVEHEPMTKRTDDEENKCHPSSVAAIANLPDNGTRRFQAEPHNWSFLQAFPLGHIIAW
jgi:hypothetical protein